MSNYPDSDVRVMRQVGYLPAGNYLREEVIEKYGVDPSRHPKLFKIWKHGHISLTEYAYTVKRAISAWNQRNKESLLIDSMGIPETA